MKALLILLAAISPALAHDFSVNDQDQQNIQGICDAAASSPSLNRDLRANLAAWCVAWEKRVQDAAKPPPVAATAPPAPAKAPTTAEKK